MEPPDQPQQRQLQAGTPKRKRLTSSHAGLPPVGIALLVLVPAASPSSVVGAVVVASVVAVVVAVALAVAVAWA